jgi:hypothetical protein
MNEHINSRGEVATFYPWHLRNQLIEAARAKDYRAIDDITDTLANLGLARPRKDASMFTSVRFERASQPPTQEEQQ